MRADRRDLRPVRVRRLREPGDRGRPHQLPDAQHPARPSRARPVGHALRRRRGPPAADPHLARARSASCARRSRRSGRCCPAAASATRRSTPSHGSEFFQVEGLMVDEGTTMGDLKGLLDQFAKAMFGADKRTRFRPGYYPFTEPSVAFDVECLVCGGVGLPGLRADRLDDDPRRRDGPPGRAPVRRPRPGALPGLRLRDGRRAHQDAQARHHRPAPVPRRTTCASWSSSDEGPLSWLRDYVDVDLDARGARRAADPARDGGQGHRALGRRTGRTSSSASCCPSSATRAPTGCR